MGGDRRRERGSFGVNVGRPVVTNGDFVAYLFFAVRGGDAALPKLLWDFLFLLKLANVVCSCSGNSTRFFKTSKG